MAVTPEIATKTIPEITRYWLHTTYDYTSQSIMIEQQIQFPVPKAGMLDLVFIAEPARLGHSFEMMSLEIAGYSSTAISIEGGIVRLIPEQVFIDEVLDIQLVYQYRLRPGPSKLGFTGRATNFGDWYLYIPPLNPDSAWQFHEPSHVGEHLVYPIADFDIRIDLVNPPQGLIMAASAQSLAGVSGYQFRHRGRNFTWSISAQYEVSEGMAGNIVVASYYFPEHAAAGKAALEASILAIHLFDKLYRPYMMDHLAIVEVEFSDGMEYHGLYFLGQEYYETYNGTPRNYLVSLAVHETAHQWFYGLVGNDQAMEPWLDEALCTFSELIFYEHYHPEVVEWWWDFRVLRFNPSGWVNGTIYDFQSFRQYVDAVYLRGALWINTLRTSLGDTLFFEALRGYLETNTMSIATAERFFEHFDVQKRESTRNLYHEYFQVLSP